MYSEFFGLNEKPFSITPDPRYLYMTNRHSDALAHLIYGIRESGGFIQLTGEVGTGKTTLIRSLLEQMPEAAKLAVILNPNLSAIEFLAAICGELDIALPEQHTRSSLISSLNRYLLQAHSRGIRVVLIVDEAQTLDAELLEQVRLLTNLETTKQKLLQIILIGQPELRELLARADMRQIAQRITGRFHLEPLSRAETQAYVRHRMRVAGAQHEVFRPGALRALHKFSGGIPRLINVVADRALLAGYTIDSPRISARLVRRAAAEVFGGTRRRWWPYPVIGGLLLLIGIMLLPPLFNDAGNASDAAVASATDEER
jgi:general secretion pathway protein A